jgi:mono/diheme cytochrome c family protein
MKEKVRILMACVVVAMLGFGLMSMTVQPKPWNIPAKYKDMKNTVKSDASSLADGKALYNQHCASCHGKAGKGDGVKAKNLKVSCGDFTNAAWQGKVKDGEVYYMSFIGNDNMPNFEKKVANEKDRWAVVNYIRNLKK